MSEVDCRDDASLIGYKKSEVKRKVKGDDLSHIIASYKAVK